MEKEIKSKATVCDSKIVKIQVKTFAFNQVVIGLLRDFVKMSNVFKSVVPNWYETCEKTERPTSGRKRNCYNCGDHRHIGPDCALKEKGTKSHRFNECGHTSAFWGEILPTNLNSERRTYDNLIQRELFPLFEQKFKSHKENMKLLRDNYIKTCEENSKLYTSINQLRQECAEMRDNRLRFEYLGEENRILREKLASFPKMAEEEREKLQNTINNLQQVNICLEDQGRELKIKIDKFREECNKLGAVSREGEQSLAMKSSNICRKPVDETKKISTFIRIKPSENPDSFNWNVDASGSILHLSSSEEMSPESFQFDQVFGPNDDNEIIFSSVLPMLRSVFKSKNVCILAVGASASGKSHTMINNNYDPGLIQRSMEYIFQEGIKEIKKLEVKCSMYEIYNERFYDLIQRREKRSNMSNFTEVPVESIEKFNAIFKLIECHRKKASTMRNNQSSRSHAIIKISMKGLSNKTNRSFKSSILFVDCAGQESADDLMQNRSKMIRSMETRTINRAYSEFVKVINNLKEKEKFVVFRGSKLTFALKPYLSGNGSILIIGTLSQEPKYLAASTLTCKTVATANQIKEYRDNQRARWV